MSNLWESTRVRWIWALIPGARYGVGGRRSGRRLVRDRARGEGIGWFPLKQTPGPMARTGRPSHRRDAQEFFNCSHQCRGEMDTSAHASFNVFRYSRIASFVRPACSRVHAYPRWAGRIIHLSEAFVDRTSPGRARS